jgi:hypothetical protein
VPETQGVSATIQIEAPVPWTMDGVRQVEAEAGPRGPRIGVTTFDEFARLRL